MREVVVVSAVRTAIGTIGGALKNVECEHLLAAVFEAAIERAGIDKGIIDEVIAGHAKQSADAPNVARLSALMVRIPESVPGYTVHRQCASSMQALLNGYQQIITGYSDVILVGGVDSMSTAPFYLRNTRFGQGSGNQVFVDPNVESQPKSQPNDIYGTFSMINTADNVAEKLGITREDCDAFSLESQRRAIAAIDSGRFKDEIVPFPVPQGRKDPVMFDTDEFPKRDTSLDKMAKLKPIYEGGVTTAGSATGRNDGACALVIMAEEKAAELGLKPLARIIAGSASGVDPRYMGLGPVLAVGKLFDRYLTPMGLTMDDIGLIELNEAFAAQSLGCIRELGLVSRMDDINVNGGAIALGHPLGDSGARICCTLIYEMLKRDVRYGIATLCAGGGMGMAMAFEKMH